MRAFKRTLCLFLAVLMLTSVLFAVPVSAATVESGTCGENLKWKLDDKGVLTISGTGKMTDYWDADAPWRKLNFTKLVVRDGVTGLGALAFYDCAKLKTVTLPESLTSLGPQSFFDCKKLSSINIPEKVTAIGWYTFANCTSLTSITIPDSVTEVSWYAFSNTGLTSVSIPKNLTCIADDAFANCAKLKKFTVDKKNTAYTTIDGVLYNKEKTSLICYPQGKTGAVTLPDTMTEIGYFAFQNCAGITSINIPDSITTIEYGAFAGCTGLTTITIPKGVQHIFDNVFLGCSSLKTIKVDSDNEYFMAADGILYDKSQSTVICCPIKKTGTVKLPKTVTTIDFYAFMNCAGLESIKLPANLDSICESAFRGCTGLTSITLPDSLTTIGWGAFNGCTGLTSVEIPAKVDYIDGRVFMGCTNLKKITVDADSPYFKAVDGILYSKDMTKIIACPMGKSGAVSLPKSVTEIEGCAFVDCTKVTSVKLPDSVTSITYAAFAGCTALGEIEIPSTVTSISQDAFRGCSALEFVSIPKSVSNIDYNAFAFAGLKEIVFEGDAPKVYMYSSEPFRSVKATAYYPKNNSTWTSEVRTNLAQNSSLTWKSYASGDMPWATPLEIKTEPKTQYVELGEKAKFTVKASGDGLTYQWYYKDADGKEYKKASGTKETYSLELTEARRDRKLYCKVTDRYGRSVKTKTVYMRAAASITTQPKTTYTELGEKAKVTVKAIGDELTYQWYYKDTGSSKYKKSSNVKATYTMEMTEARKDRKVYCVVTDKRGHSVQSKTVTLRMAASIKTEPKSVTTTIGKKATFTVKALGDDLTYQWYYKDTDSSKYKKASGTKATYSIELTKERNGRKFYCVVTDKYGNEVKTKTVSMKKK